MSDLHRAIELVRGAEHGLRDLMRRAIEQQRYRDVAEIAPVADTLADLVRRTDAEHGALVGAPITAAPAVPVAMEKAQPRSSSRDEYPRFERDGDKLVKVGWSKKDKREYEHRAPHETVHCVASRLASAVRPGKVFSMDKLMPFKDNAGADIPSYQAYLALAWFRDLGSVEQRGKEGYVVSGGSPLPESVEHAWKSIQ